MKSFAEYVSEYVNESRKNRSPSAKNLRGFRNWRGETRSDFAKYDAYMAGQATDHLGDRNIPKRLRGGKNPYPKGLRHDQYERGRKGE